MKEIADNLRRIIAEAEPALARLPAEDTGFKPAPDEWSKREILGHLIDSAANNHQRFVRAVGHGELHLPPYNQTRWVCIQRYNDCGWASLISLWSAYNRHLSHVIESIPQGAENVPCDIGREHPVSLEFVATDYVRHVQHHLKDIVGVQRL